jgi:hypothetical protein
MGRRAPLLGLDVFARSRAVDITTDEEVNQAVLQALTA